MKHSCALIINYLDFIYALYIEDNAMMTVFMIFANEIHKIMKICPFFKGILQALYSISYDKDVRSPKFEDGSDFVFSRPVGLLCII